MDTQEAFNEIVFHSRTQKTKCGSDFCCYYRGPKNTDLEGMVCFVGKIIPDDEYDKSWDEEKYGAPVEDIYYDIPSLENVDLGVLQECQSVHDKFDPNEWELKLRIVATGFNLEFPE